MEVNGRKSNPPPTSAFRRNATSSIMVASLPDAGLGRVVAVFTERFIPNEMKNGALPSTGSEWHLREDVSLWNNMYKTTANSNKSSTFVHKIENMNEKIKILFRQNNGYLTRQQLSSRYMYYQLLKFVRAGIVKQPKRGVFCFNNEMHNSIDIDIESVIPDGVLCLFSAWFHYGLTTTIPHSYYIAIEKKRKIVLPDYPPIELHYWQRNQYELGISSYTKDGVNIKIYDIEKSVCDAVKFRNKVGIDIAAEVLKNYLRRQGRNLTKLVNYARQMRIEKILRTYLEVEL